MVRRLRGPRDSPWYTPQGKRLSYQPRQGSSKYPMQSNSDPPGDNSDPPPLAASQVPRIIPVIDVMGGVVVRAVAGRRDQYRPLVSRLTNSTDPRDVAQALRDHTGTRHLYLADL